MTFTLMITTRDRRQDLELTGAELRQLAPAAAEVLICADGCRDDTLKVMRAKFPEFTLLENETSKGSVFSRDRMLRVARGEIVVSLDDDSFPADRNFLQQLGAAFEKHPEAAVIGFAEICGAGALGSRGDAQHIRGRYVSAYANCGAAMRRKFYLERRGYADFFEHMYEEPDYALQCYAAGAAVWFEPSLRVVHRESHVNRDVLRRHQLNARNELWSAWLRCPWPWVALVSLYRIARQFVYACSQGVHWMVREPCWWIAAARGMPRCGTRRDAVRWAVYYQWMRLARKPIHSTQELMAKFPSGKSSCGL